MGQSLEAICDPWLWWTDEQMVSFKIEQENWETEGGQIFEVQDHDRFTIAQQKSTSKETLSFPGQRRVCMSHIVWPSYKTKTHLYLAHCLALSSYVYARETSACSKQMKTAALAYSPASTQFHLSTVHEEPLRECETRVYQEPPSNFEWRRGAKV